MPFVRCLYFWNWIKPNRAKFKAEKKGVTMPHIIIKMHPGRSEEQKLKLVDSIAASVVRIAKCELKSISIAIEEVPSEEWAEKVYKPDILEKKHMLYKEPGYNPPG
jgi:4-oxalocrotonate tautomerase